MFGVGSELAATGVNGPAIFPSTALAVRLRVTTARSYGALAVVNAHAGTIGDEALAADAAMRLAMVLGESLGELDAGQTWMHQAEMLRKFMNLQLSRNFTERPAAAD